MGREDQTDLKEDSSLASRRVHPTRAFTTGRLLLIVAAVAGVAAIALALLLGRRSSSQEGRPVPAPSGAAVPSPSNGASTPTDPQPGDITISLSSDKIESAQIKTEAATEQTDAAAPTSDGLRTTGLTQSNGYKETPVFPIAGGIVRNVNVELGDKVTRGRALAVIFSTELANAQSDYLKMLADEEEHHEHYHRTLELVEIGAVSREELEMVTAKHKTAQANTASARQRLILLGMSPKQVDGLKTAGEVSSLISVPSPVSGTVINRAVNTGEVVDKGKELFRVADLSTVWVVGQVYEADFTRVRLGTPAVITAAAYPGRSFNGVVSYIDPRVDPNTRTAQVRTEVRNPGEVLRLGMFVDVSFGGAAPAVASGQRLVLVPRAAVQAIGARQVIFVATSQPGLFIQREVTVGPEAHGLVSIFSGVSAGERVVSEGSFLLRAESLKLNPEQSMAPAKVPNNGALMFEPPRRVQSTEIEAGSQAVTVAVTAKGFLPETINLKRGAPARLTFVREIEETCAKSVMIPEYNIKRDLPLNEPVVVEFTPVKKGVFDFTCGMKMLSGKIVVR